MGITEKWDVDYNKINKYLASKGVSQQELSRRLGKTESYYSAIKSHNCKITTECAMKIVQVLELPEKWDFFVIKDKETEAPRIKVLPEIKDAVGSSIYGNIAIDFDFAICVTSGDGFKKGWIYPIVGWNNGAQIVRRKQDNEDYFEGCYQTGGIGKGLFNNYNNTGAPSFNPCKGCIYLEETDY